jgi:hypothetical protein
MATITIDEESLRHLLNDNDHMRKQVTELQNRGTELLMENRELKKEVLKLQDGIRKHRDASGHSLCWYVPELWDLLPDKLVPKPEIPSTQEFLHCCKLYRASLEKG